ncbi:MAG: hypothetical protein ACE5OZ_10605 [Candidatus Heimdallarchaeota archaeon]
MSPQNLPNGLEKHYRIGKAAELLGSPRKDHPCSPWTQQASMTSRPSSGDETPSPVERSASDPGVEPANRKLS